MANICTNLFFCSTENKENLKTVENYMTDTFGEGWYCYCSDEQMVEGEFESKWSFPENFFERITAELSHAKTLYMRILSYEFGNEYASFRVYRDGEWDIKF